MVTRWWYSCIGETGLNGLDDERAGREVDAAEYVAGEEQDRRVGRFRSSDGIGDRLGCPLDVPGLHQLPGQLCVMVGGAQLELRLVLYEVFRLGTTRLATLPCPLDGFRPAARLLCRVWLRDHQRGLFDGQIAKQVVAGRRALDTVVERSEQK